VKGLLANRYVLAALIIVVLGGLFELTGISRPVSFAQGSQLHIAKRAAVSTALRGCPGPGSTGATSSGIAMAAVPAAAGPAAAGPAAAGPAPAGAGRAEVVPLSPQGSATGLAPVRTVSQPGRLALLTVPKAPVLGKKLTRKLTAGRAPAGGSVPTTTGRGGMIVQATGAMSSGLEVEQTGTGKLVTGRCNAPGTDFWFIGPAGRSVAEIQLYLMNVGDQPADAQVSALTEGVPLLAGSDIGITIPPHGMVVQSLARLLRGSTVAALHVSTNAGLIVAALRETKKSTQLGAWLPAASAPATRLVLPSVPGSPGTRELYVGVPGTQDAQVKLTAVTSRGSYQPTGGSGIALPGGSAVSIALPSLSGVPAAIVVSANVPVTAAMMVPGGAAGAPGAFTAASGPVREQGVIADNPGSTAGSSALVLSAPHAAASVRVTVTSQKAAITAAVGRAVRIAAGHSVVVRLRPPRGTTKTSAFSVVITPLAGSGPVYAGRVITARGVVQSILPVISSPTWVALPPVRDSQSVVLP
jgi:hypothetical protein